MCDSRVGISANFLHTPARRNKSGALPRRKRDCADNPLDKLPTETRKPLKLADLSHVVRTIEDMLMDVNKRA
jgi:hypothetical protein